MDTKGYRMLGFVGFADRGDYASNATYMQNDLVHSGNIVWKCKRDNVTGVEPIEGDYWGVFVRGGAGKSGKSAYEYAKDGGYAGSEEDFAKKLALETYSKEVIDSKFTEANGKLNELKNSENYVDDEGYLVLGSATTIDSDGYIRL